MPCPRRLYPYFAAALLCACAKPGPRGAPAAPSGTAGAQTLVAVQRVESLPAAQALLTAPGASVSCASGQDCPAAVGLLLAADAAGGLDPGSDALLGCTATLVGADLALTNSHCIPSAVKLLPDLCAARVRLVLPAAEGQPAESLACAQLLGFSARETATSPDLALIRLERKTGRTPLPVGRGGVAPAGTLRAFRVTPDLRTRTGVLATADCRTVPDSYRMPVYHGAADPVFVAGDCVAVPGNSGSPFLAANGQLVGVLQADLPVAPDALAQWLPHLAAPDTAFAPLALGTSLACLGADPGAGVFTWNAACATISDEDVLAARPLFHTLIASPLFLGASPLGPYLAQTPILRWTAKPLALHALDGTATLAPACLAPPSAWAGAFGNPLPESASLSLREPRYGASLRFNRYLQLVTPAVTLAGEASATFGFSPRAAASSGTAILTTVGGGTLALPACPPLATK